MWVGAGLPHFAVYQWRKRRRDPFSLQTYGSARNILMPLRCAREQCRDCVVIATDMDVVVSSGPLGVAARLLEAACLSRTAPLATCKAQRPCDRLCRCAAPRMSQAKIWALGKCHCSHVRGRRLASYIDEIRPDAMIFNVTSRVAMNRGGSPCSWLRERAL